MLEAAAIHTGFKKSTHPRTSSSTELLSDPTLPYLCSCPGAKCSADASTPSLTPKLIKPWVLIPCSWTLRGGGCCYDSLTTQIPKICSVYSTHLWIQRMKSGSGAHCGKDKDLGLRRNCSHATYVQDRQHIVIPPPVPQISCIKQLLFVLHASEGPMALSCCGLRAWGCSD